MFLVLTAIEWVNKNNNNDDDNNNNNDINVDDDSNNYSDGISNNRSRNTLFFFLIKLPFRFDLGEEEEVEKTLFLTMGVLSTINNDANVRTF